MYGVLLAKKAHGSGLPAPSCNLACQTQKLAVTASVSDLHSLCVGARPSRGPAATGRHQVACGQAMDWMLSARLLHHAPPSLRTAHSSPCQSCRPQQRRACLQPVAAAPKAAAQMDRALAEDQEREARQGELETALANPEVEADKPRGTDQKKKHRSRRFRAMAELVPGDFGGLCPQEGCILHTWSLRAI